MLRAASKYKLYRAACAQWWCWAPFITQGFPGLGFYDANMAVALTCCFILALGLGLLSGERSLWFCSPLLCFPELGGLHKWCLQWDISRATWAESTLEFIFAAWDRAQLWFHFSEGAAARSTSSISLPLSFHCLGPLPDPVGQYFLSPFGKSAHLKALSYLNV